MKWTTNDELVGRCVMIYTAYGEDEPAEVLAVSTRGTALKVRALADDEIMVGNQWEELDD